jgi:hypothetical protein
MLSGIGSAIAFVAGIVVLVKLFQTKGLVHGLIGLVTCNIYTYIWGWMNIKKEELKLKNWMYWWTGAIVLGIILNIIGATSGGGGEESRLLLSLI